MMQERSSQTQKGWICLDIDGTLTDQMFSIPKNVTNYIKKLYFEGWKIIFVTGRMFSLGIKPLEKLDFPFYFSPQNGASWFEMPKQVLGQKKYLSLQTFLQLETLLEETDLDFVLITGIEHKDQCFYRPSRLTSDMVHYFENTLSKLAGTWHPVKDFKNLPIDEYPYAKIYGSKSELNPIFDAFEKIPAIKSYLIRDSAHSSNYTLHVMREDVDKGKAVLDIMKKEVIRLPIIAAGNDCNDETLLDIADIKIAMPSSPPSLLERATLIAPPVGDEGIIAALELAIKEVEVS